MLLPSSPSIEIHQLKNKIDVRKGVVFDGFQGAGMANTIACQCFINTLDTELVAVLDSVDFPPISVIYDSKPNFPARIYANEKLKMAFFVSEINLDPVLYRPISNILLEWAAKNECELVISSVGKHNTESKSGSDNQILAVANRPGARSLLKNSSIPIIKDGTIQGIPAILLNEGMRKNMDVIVLIVDSYEKIADFRAAASISEGISRIIPRARCDVNSLIKEAVKIEENLKAIRSNQSDELANNMYR
jgi:uncharacterized protein